MLRKSACLLGEVKTNDIDRAAAAALELTRRAKRQITAPPKDVLC
ncbi:hypothetical protein A2U01_0071872 [Trifolium medium]|uniref:Uncharacterized protein n=1 Tax=Trifolium medium TaxID=97028 RepID=A0A392SP13_9FABA|nr:hypothetical protein [Trifolium medium]